jgi:hypothetical protein
MPLTGEPTTWAADTQQGVILNALFDAATGDGRHDVKCPTCDAAYLALRPSLGSGALRFYRNPTGSERAAGITGRIELPPGKERGRKLRWKVREVHAYAADWTGSEDPAPMPEPEPEPEPMPVPTVSADAERFYSEVQRLRGFVRARDLESLDSMRVVIDGAKALKAGVPVEGLIGSLQASWQADTRAQADRYILRSEDALKAADGFDYASHAPRPSRFSHAVSGYVAKLVAADIPVWLHGPAGTGKSSAAKHAAEVAGLDYYEVNLAGAMASAIKGKDRLKEFVESEFARAYEHGGVCVLEEFDAAHPTVATAVNNAIAGSEFHNDADGRSIKRHPDFRLVATANTLGTGATKEFNSRMKLDGATLDRFRMGRVYVGLDLELERAIFDSIVA